MTRLRLLVGVVVIGGHAGLAAAQTPDLGGFWELPFDSRNVPEAALAPAVTPAVLAE